MRARHQVLFVGAGLSAAFGYALTSQILPEILRRLRARELLASSLPANAHALRDEFEGLIVAFMPKLLQVAPNDLPAITDVLSLMDHLIGSAQSASPEMTVDFIVRLRELFELSICDLLCCPMDVAKATSSRSVLDSLADWILAGRNGSTVTVITTNYDFVLEEALCRRLRFGGLDPEYSIDYGFTWRSIALGDLRHRPAAPSVRFLRLHGAINWLRCRMCGFIYINTRGPNFHQADRSVDDSGNICHCSALRLQRVIVAPSTVRKMDDPDLQTVWKAALEELRLAERWTILGYSMPHEDVAIRGIVIRALRGREVQPRIDVFERKRKLKPRFQLLFPNLQFSSAGVERFVSMLEKRSTA